MPIPTSGDFSIYSGPVAIEFIGGPWYFPTDPCGSGDENDRILNPGPGCSESGASGTARGSFLRGKIRIDGADYTLSSLPSGFTILTAQYFTNFWAQFPPGNGTVECTVGIGGVRDMNDSPYTVTNLSIANLLGPHAFVHTGTAVPNGSIIAQMGADSTINSGAPAIHGTYVIRSRVLQVSFDGGRDMKFDDSSADYIAPHWKWDDT